MKQNELDELFMDRPLVIPSQKPATSVPKPADRPAKWIKYEDLVAFVIIDRNGKPRIRTGHVTSWPGSHGAGLEVDNVVQTIVWCDQVLNDLADNADDAYEESFDPKDPNLLRLDELEPLKNPETAIVWFQGIHSPEISRQISVLLSKPDLGHEDECKEEAEALESAHEAVRKKLGWWQGAEFHPPVVAEK